jgi:hypothetical protein
MERLRTPFFIVALIAMTAVVAAEIGAPLFIGGDDAGAALGGQAAGLGVDVPHGGTVTEPRGSAIRYLALVDVIPLFTVALMGAGMVLPQRLHGRIQGVVTVVVAILLILAALVLLVLAVAQLVLMVTLLLAFPFGTIAYLIIWGFFPRGDAAVLLSVLMFLKVVFAVALVAAQQRFLQNKGLVLIIATSLVCNVVAAFLHGVVPTILASITDQIGAIVFAVVAIVWALVLLFGSIPGIVRAARSATAVAGVVTTAAPVVR